MKMSDILDIPEVSCYTDVKHIRHFRREEGRTKMNQKMRKRRQERNLSQSQLAALIGVSRQTVNMVESGEYNPTLALCLRICRALGCTLDELFWDNENPNEKDGQ